MHPLVLRRNRLPITEKLAAPDGKVKVPLNEEEVRQAVSQLKEGNVDVVVVSFLFSFLNDAHEKRAKEIVKEMSQRFYVLHQVKLLRKCGNTKDLALLQ